MKAIVYHEYGSPEVLKCEEVEKPVPKDDEVFIKVRAASVNPLDWRLMKGEPRIMRLFLGLRKPKVGRPGVDFAGEIEAVGRNVAHFKPGDEVFGGCSGAFAEYACTAASKLAMKPGTVTFEQAASVNVAGLTALQGLRDKGKIQPGYKVLINGAAGGVGTFAVQIAKTFGANVTGVCSTRNLELVKSIGADEVIDYTQQDFTKSDLTSNQRYDLILECVGNHSFSECRRVLKPDGRYVGVGAPHDVSMTGLLAPIIKDLVLSVFGSQKSVMFIAKSSQEDLTLIGEMIATGKIKPVIDKSYSLSEATDAVRHVEEGHARGKGDNPNCLLLVRGAADSIKPGVKRSETPGTVDEIIPPAERPIAVGNHKNASPPLSAVSRALDVFGFADPGVSLRFTPGFTPSPASEGWATAVQIKNLT